VARHYNHTVLVQQPGTSIPSRLNYLDLDPTYKDAWGLPLASVALAPGKAHTAALFKKPSRR
jgi:hypothetical protein